MGLYPPSFTAATLANLDAAGIAIVQDQGGWFIKFYQHVAGPYDTPEAALEASMPWISPSDTREVAGNNAAYHDRA